MKTLVVYYSKTGNTRKIAQEIAKETGADMDEIKDSKKVGMLGLVRASWQAMRKKPSKITFSKDPAKYDLVILGGPVWAWNLIPQIRNYLENNKDKIKKLVFFLTHGGGPGKSIDQVSMIKKPILSAEFLDKDIKAGKYEEDLKEFIKKLEV